jgi:hypothetical protein
MNTGPQPDQMAEPARVERTNGLGFAKLLTYDVFLAAVAAPTARFVQLRNSYRAT